MNTAAFVDEQAARMKETGYRKEIIIRELAEMCLGWPYVFGAAGEICTPKVRQDYAGLHPEYKEKIYGACPALSKASPSGGGGPRSGSERACDTCKWHGVRCFDCRGFTRWLLSQVGVSLYGGGATTQWEYGPNWAAKGSIDTIPKTLTCCVFKRKEGKMSHTGMYLPPKASPLGSPSGEWAGNEWKPIGVSRTGLTEPAGETVARSAGEGHIIHCSTTVKEDHLPGNSAASIGATASKGSSLVSADLTADETSAKGRSSAVRPPWTHWAIPAGLYNIEDLRREGLNVTEEQNTPTLRKGSQGDAVKELQKKLNALGYYHDSLTKLTVDGVFGERTEKAVKKFQIDRGLTADGIVGAKTRAMLDPLGKIMEQRNGPSQMPFGETDTIDSRLGEAARSAGEGPQDCLIISMDDLRALKTAVSAAWKVIEKYEQEASNEENN